MTEKITNPHDKLFKEVWSKKQNAIDFLNNYLPKNILKLMDLNSLAISKDSFIDEKLKEFYSDMLYQVNIMDKKGYLYFLFEHKSYPDYFIHLQLLEYLVKIWRQEIKNNPKIKTLPVVIPMVLYHGKSTWKIHKNFLSLFNAEDGLLKRFIPDFEYILFDLTIWSDDEIMGNIYTKAVLLLFKYIFKPELREKLPDILSLLNELENNESGLQYIESLLKYLMNSAEKFSFKELKEISSNSLSDNTKEAIMTIAEELIHRGMEQGLEQGLKQGWQQGLQEGLHKGLIFSLYLKFGRNNNTEAIISLVRQINDLGKLDIIQDKILSVNSVDEFKNFVIEIMG